MKLVLDCTIIVCPKRLCASDFCIVICKCTETLWSPCIYSILYWKQNGDMSLEKDRFLIIFTHYSPTNNPPNATLYTNYSPIYRQLFQVVTFLSGWPNKTLYTFPFSFSRTTRPVHPSPIYVTHRTGLGQENKPWSSLSRSFPQSPVTSSPLSQMSPPKFPRHFARPCSTVSNHVLQRHPDTNRLVHWWSTTQSAVTSARLLCRLPTFQALRSSSVYRHRTCSRHSSSSSSLCLMLLLYVVCTSARCTSVANAIFRHIDISS